MAPAAGPAAEAVRLLLMAAAVLVAVAVVGKRRELELGRLAVRLMKNLERV